MSMNKLSEIFDVESIKKYYGTTNSFLNCGYILPNGEMLMYNNTRVIEHFEVEKFYKERKCDCKEINGKPNCEHKCFCRYAIRDFFIFCGSIRCIPLDIRNKNRLLICNIGGHGFNKNKLKIMIEEAIFNYSSEVIIEVNKYKEKINPDNIRFLQKIKDVNLECNINNYSNGIINRIEGIINA